MRTFRGVAEMHVSAYEAGWRNEKHRAHWRSTLEAYAYPVIGDVPVAAIRTDHVLCALQPIWTEKLEAAARVRGRIEAGLFYAAARIWRQGENPARWRGHLDYLLPRRSKVATVENHASLPWQQMAAFHDGAQSDQRDRGPGARVCDPDRLPQWRGVRRALVRNRPQGCRLGGPG
ncbi:phage integrase central domain-containing protein [Belnapia moabensis]|uniref:phage integrase central domain-containing protein n=1 Tax=Belnapia moabensis TaxID=365533 RepID=UPI001FDF5E6B|nr:hypothetical protein [Belnapia moabensis]